MSIASDAAPMGGASEASQHRKLSYRYRPSAPPPPWLPGMAPPVPGPVFSPAFNALLVLLVIGCGVLGVNLKTSIDAMRASSLGEDNEVLTKGQPGTQAWLRNVQQSKGLRPSLKPHEIEAAIDEEAAQFSGSRKKSKERGKERGKDRGKERSKERSKDRKARKGEEDSSDGYEMNEVAETEALRPKKASTHKSSSKPSGGSGRSKPKARGGLDD